MDTKELQKLEEAYALRVHITAHVRLFENYYAQFVLGTMTDEDWRAMRQVISNNFRVSVYRSVFSQRDDVWNSEFATEVKQILSEIDAEAA